MSSVIASVLGVGGWQMRLAEIRSTMMSCSNGSTLTTDELLRNSDWQEEYQSMANQPSKEWQLGKKSKQL